MVVFNLRNGSRALVLLLAVVTSTCRSRSPMLPDGASCGLGPIVLPASGPTSCGITSTGCPLLRPEGARTLVSAATCDYATGGTPCATRTTVCPLVDPNGNVPMAFTVTETPCPSSVYVLLQSSGDGGAGVEWRVQERTQTPQGCVDTGPQRVGVANVYGACCATTVDIPMLTLPRTFRLRVQTDWRN